MEHDERARRFNLIGGLAAGAALGAGLVLMLARPRAPLPPPRRRRAPQRGGRRFAR